MLSCEPLTITVRTTAWRVADSLGRAVVAGGLQPSHAPGWAPRPCPTGYTGACAGVAKLADARDLKSRVAQAACGFDPHPRHFRISLLQPRAIGFASSLKTAGDLPGTCHVAAWHLNRRGARQAHTPRRVLPEPFGDVVHDLLDGLPLAEVRVANKDREPPLQSARQLGEVADMSRPEDGVSRDADGFPGRITGVSPCGKFSTRFFRSVRVPCRAVAPSVQRTAR